MTFRIEQKHKFPRIFFDDSTTIPRPASTFLDVPMTLPRPSLTFHVPSTPRPKTKITMRNATTKQTHSEAKKMHSITKNKREHTHLDELFRTYSENFISIFCLFFFNFLFGHIRTTFVLHETDPNGRVVEICCDPLTRAQVKLKLLCFPRCLSPSCFECVFAFQFLLYGRKATRPKISRGRAYKRANHGTKETRRSFNRSRYRLRRSVQTPEETVPMEPPRPPTMETLATDGKRKKGQKRAGCRKRTRGGCGKPFDHGPIRTRRSGTTTRSRNAKDQPRGLGATRLFQGQAAFGTRRGRMPTPN